jgi:hypothetical protein
MSFLGGIFKKKPGGTLFGNLLRSGASMATGGLLGSGKNMIPLDAPPPPPIMSNNVEKLVTNITGIGGALGDAAGKAANGATKEWLKKNWWMLAIPGGLVIVLAFMAFKKGRR